jgi:hypothetical protein
MARAVEYSRAWYASGTTVQESTATTGTATFPRSARVWRGAMNVGTWSVTTRAARRARRTRGEASRWPAAASSGDRVSRYSAYWMPRRVKAAWRSAADSRMKVWCRSLAQG